MLKQRRSQVLKVVVEDYVSRIAPVSSEEVASKVVPPVSSATIRNDMATLAEEGYVHRPHTSAGCVPSTKGYRSYVDSLGPIPRQPEAVKERLLREFIRLGGDMEAWVRMAAHVLSDMVDNVALVTYPNAKRARLKRLDLVYMQEFLAMLVLVLEEARVRQHLLPLKERVTQEELNTAASKLNTLFLNHDYQELEGDNQAELTPLEQQVKGLASAILRDIEQQSTLEHELWGLRYLLTQPEFSQGRVAGEVVEALEDQAVVRNILVGAPQGEQVRALIGEENREEVLHPLAFVMCRYGLPGRGNGVVTIIGPTRMAYRTGISSAQLVSSLLTELVTTVHGRS